MAKEENPDKKKKKSEEVADYESLLDDFTGIFNDSGEESGDSKVDHDGLALSELLGEDVTITAEPVEAEKSESGSEEELSDFTQKLEGFDLDEFTESDEAGETAGKEDITIEDSADETLTIDHGIDALTDIYNGSGPAVEEQEEEATAAVDDSAATQEIEALGFDDLAESVTPDETMAEEEPAVDHSADTGELEGLDFGKISDTDQTVEEPEEEATAADDSAVTQEIEALGFDDLEETVIADEVVVEEADTAADSADSQEPEVLDFESVADLDVSAEEVKEDEFSIDNGMEDTSADTIVEEPVDDSASEMILDEEVTVSDSDYASILDQLDGGKAEEEETLDVSDVEELNILEDDDTGEISFVDIEKPEEESSDVEASEDSVFMDLDLDFDDEEEDFVPEEEPAVSVASPVTGEDDFLGLSGISGEGGGSSGGVGSATEVLFEGVEMNFDEQIALVTHAEILLAQKKNEEATELLKRVVDEKGETHWVAKRLRTFGAQVQKPDTSE